MRNFILLLFAAAVAPAQVVSVGVKAGIPVTQAIAGRGNSFTSMLDTGRWTVGPTVELRLFRGLSAEADALFRGYRQQDSFLSGEMSDGTTTYPAMAGVNRSDTKVWDFPVLLKYRFGSRPHRPFVNAGYTWSRSTSDITSSLNCLSSASACDASSLSSYYHAIGHVNNNDSTGGPTAGLGIEFRIGKFKLAPEIRYTHSSNPTSNRVTILAGFTY